MNPIASLIHDNMTTKMEWPQAEDVAGSIHALFAIQHTYRIPVADLAKGRLGERKTFATLQIEDIDHIVANRLESETSLTHIPGKDYAICIEWIEAAIRYIFYKFHMPKRDPF